jgi:NAD(P)-dependent dehydrogenase (short-subunit alcohol dehydrogenase family)
VSVSALDLSDQHSVRAFTAALERPLHILVNNAGIMAPPELERTSEGWELQFATNFMGHFAITTGLHDALAAAHGARIVSVSSKANLRSPVVFDDLHFDFRPYDPIVAYGQSKTADALLAVEATRRWSGEGIHADALNPGAIATVASTPRSTAEAPGSGPDGLA